MDSNGDNSSNEVAAGAVDKLDFSSLFNETGESLSMKDGDNFQISFDGGSNYSTLTYSTNGDGSSSDGNFQTTNGLREELQNLAQNQNNNATVTVNDQGKFEVINGDQNGNNLTIKTKEGSQNNQNLLDMMTPLEGTIPADGSSKISQSFYSATHASSIDIFDSLGTKHTLRTAFRKLSQDANGSTWQTVLNVPDPGEISTASPKNYLVGTIKFNSDGSLATYTPSSVSFTGNNGSKPKQTVNLDLGTANQFDGMTSFDATSNTSGISQDGYPGGDLDGIRVDETGTLIGSFTNGRSFGLAQVSMASFANNVGLESNGGGTYIQTSNSGDPIIGQAATGKRGSIQASSLEMSNVDLSRSLTQLIVIQRGFQANSKTITTSDQMLNTLLQLKQ